MLEVEKKVLRNGRILYPDVEVEIAVSHRSREFNQLPNDIGRRQATYSTLKPTVGIVVTTSPICLLVSDRIKIEAQNGVRLASYL